MKNQDEIPPKLALLVIMTIIAIGSALGFGLIAAYILLTL
jgi:hypothetical protein